LCGFISGKSASLLRKNGRKTATGKFAGYRQLNFYRSGPNRAPIYDAASSKISEFSGRACPKGPPEFPTVCFGASVTGVFTGEVMVQVRNVQIPNVGPMQLRNFYVRMDDVTIDEQKSLQFYDSLRAQ
jgi:hypothetical protein